MVIPETGKGSLEEAITNLRSKIPDIIADDPSFDEDVYLAAWLKGKNLNPEKAEKTIRKAVAWRKKNEVNSNFDSEDFQELAKEIRFKFSYSTVDGKPLCCLNIANTDNEKMYAKFGWQKIVQVLYKLMATWEREMVEFNKKSQTKPLTVDSVSGITVIVDVMGFPKTPFPMIDGTKICMEALPALSHFPVILGEVFIINLTKMFSMVLKVARPILSSKNLTIGVHAATDFSWEDRIKAIMGIDDVSQVLIPNA